MKSFTPRVKQALKETGCYKARDGRGDHEIWFSPISKRHFVVDGDIQSRHTANGILKQAGLPKQF